MSKVYIALQDNEESHYIVEAIEDPGARGRIRNRRGKDGS